MIKTLLGVILIVAASVGATLFYSSGGLRTVSAETRPPLPPPLPGPIFVPLEPFTVTLSDNDSSRILYVAITLRVADETSRHLLSLYMPEVRNRVLLQLSMQRPAAVQTPDGRTRLATDLAKVLAAPYIPQPLGPTITNVLFTAFVVQ